MLRSVVLQCCVLRSVVLRSGSLLRGVLRGVIHYTDFLAGRLKCYFAKRATECMTCASDPL